MMVVVMMMNGEEINAKISIKKIDQSMGEIFYLRDAYSFRHFCARCG